MDFDNPGEDHSDFTDSERSGKEKREKILLGSSKKKDKEKKKEKETRYNQLGAESSNDEEDVKGSGKGKKKAFKIGLAKKDKKEKKDKESKEKDKKDKESKEKDKKEKENKDKDVVDAKDHKEKKKEKKDKPKLKLKKSHKTDSDTDKKNSETVTFPPIFGVDLDTAVERNRSHDGVKLPVVVRECVDYIEAEGLTVEGIYRSSGVKSKISKLRTAYNSRQAVKLSCYEPAVVASLFKMFLRELPEPVLTNRLNAKFEEVSQMKVYTDRRDGLLRLMSELPECNRVLVQWVFVHMGHVIASEKMNKMTLQNVSIVLSPTMRISHRVLNCIFEHHAALFSDVRLVRYIPPIPGPLDASKLPERPAAIELEMRKQESLLSELHAEVSSGVMLREEQLWETQRIVTHLKRCLKNASKNVKQQEQDYEEELNFALQTVIVKESSSASKEQLIKETSVPVVESPEESQEHKVTVQIHRDQDKSGVDGHVTVIQLNKPPMLQPTSAAVLSSSSSSTPARPAPTPPTSKIMPPPPVPSSSSVASSTPAAARAPGHVSTPSSAPGALSSSVKPIRDQLQESEPIRERVNSSNNQSDASVKPINQSEVTEPTAQDMTQSSPNSTQQFASQVVSFSSPIMSTKMITDAPHHPPPGVKDQSKIPLLPPPPASSKPKTTNRCSTRPAASSELLPPDNKLKSKSLPRGLPSDGAVFDSIDSSSEVVEDNKVETNKVETVKAVEESREKIQQRDALMLEEMRLKFQYEELMTLKSELERKKRTERREIAELQEEIATMQTLYQYRTYSVDSSEDDSDANELGDINNTKEARAEKLKLLNRLVKEKKELEEKKLTLQTKLAEERSACIKLRVSIRMEQERIKRQKLSQFPGIGFGKLNLMDD